MSYYINNAYISSYHEGKKGYVNKFEKSLKSPFLNILHNHLPGVKPLTDDDLSIDASDLAISDNIELSSAVVTATGANESDTGVGPGA